MTTLSVLDAAREEPGRVALVHGDREVSFAELAERVRGRISELSSLLTADARFIDETLVALQCDESPQTLEVMLALFELGVAVLPLHPRLTRFERQQVLAELPVRSVIELDAEGVKIEVREPHPDAIAATLLRGAPQLVAMTTSGSTGQPRVALLSRRAFLASAAASAGRLGFHSGDRWLLALPLAHIGGLSVVTRCLIARRPIVMLSPRSAESSVERLARAISEGAPTLLSLVPTQLDSLIALGARFKMPERVRVILVGGAATPRGLLRACERQRWPVVTSYGLTEACSQVATRRPGAEAEDAGVGRPLPGVSIELVDGVIHVRGPTLMSGYIGPGGSICDPDLGFRTRDVGQLDAEGCLHVLGRVDDAIVSGGEKVSPSEVEAVLEACPGVLEACVFGVPDAHWGQVVIAGLRVADASEAALASIVERARAESEQKLAAFKRPKRYACCAEFALGPTGKLDRRRTATLLARGAR